MPSLRVLCMGCLALAIGMRATAEEARPPEIPPSTKMEITPFPKPRPPRPVKPVPKLTEQYPDLLPVTIQALKDEDMDVRTNAMKTLMNLGREAVPALAETLKGKDINLRVWAALVLGNLGGEAKEALPSLLTIAKDEKENKLVRNLVSRAITRIVEDAP